MVLFISLGSVCAVSDVSESVNINEGILNSVDNNDTTHLQINELSDIANTCDNDSVDISNESNAESINNCVNDYNSESNAESNNNCDDDYESDYNVELNNDYNENINNLNVSSSESINENNISYNNSSNNYPKRIIRHYNKNGKYISGRWSVDEHKKFLEAIIKYGNDWKKVQQYVGTRTCTQARSHAQKFFVKLGF